MGLFADDDLQDERLNLLERHVRALTETVQQNQVDITACTIMLLTLQAQIDEKVSASEVDPAVSALNNQLGEARVRLKEASDQAAEAWAGAQSDLSSMMEGLRAKAQELSKEIESA